MPNGDVQQNSLLLNRPFSTNGLPPSLSGVVNMNVNGASVAKDFYVEALPGERLAVARAIVNIQSATDIGANEYGDIAALANGIQVFYKSSALDATIDISGNFPIKQNEDWGRWCYDSQPISIGPTQNTKTWQARWTFTRYGNPWGLVLEEGDRIGIRIRDNLSSLVSHTIIAEGVHLGSLDPRWIQLLS